MNSMTLRLALDNYFDDSGVALQETMAHGRENTSIKLELADGKRLILRVWGAEHSHIGRRKLSDITGELAFMIRCHEAGIAVPKVYISRQGKPYAQLDSGEYFMLMDFVPGSSPQDLTHDMVRQVAKAMAQMHVVAQDFAFAVERSWLGTVVEMTEVAVENYVQQSEIDHSLRDYLGDIRTLYQTQLQQVDLKALPRGPIHGDIFWENLKFEDGKLAGIFDFDDCRTSYFIEDILKTLLYDFDDPVHGFYGNDGSNVAVFLQAYQEVRPLTDAERSAMPALFTISIAYRLTAHIRRLLRGNGSYKARIPALIEAYETRKQTFTTSF